MIILADSRIIRERLVFTGSVQGVGFRFRAKYAAIELGITGWVQNEWDGSVVMEAQGTKNQINELMTVVNQSRFIRIDWVDREEIPVVLHEKGFHAR